MKSLIQNVTVLILVSMLAIVAQQSESLSMDEHKENASEKFPDWQKGKLVRILICPKVLPAKEDPLAGPTEKDRLSVMGFGQMTEENSALFVSSMLTKDLPPPRLTGGFHAELYLLFSDRPFEDQDKVSCYITDKSVDIRISDRKRGGIWVGLPDACVKLINDNFVKQSESVN
jgi:hypothetical protein